MTFAQTLERYLAELGCTASGLAQAAGISSASVSRYRIGTRVPSKDSETLPCIARGICDIARQEGIDGYVFEEVLAHLSEAAVDPSVNDSALSNVSTLLSALDARNTDLSRVLNYDPSYLSRIRSGQRKPSDVDSFVRGVSEFAAKRCCSSSEARKQTSQVLGLDALETSEEKLALQLQKWIYSGQDESSKTTSHFVESLSTFDLDEFIRAIHFDEIQAPPTIPVSIPREKIYQGTDGLRQGEMDFLHATLLSPKNDPVLSYSDMDMQDLAQDVEFSKRWMGGLAMLLKRGLHMNLIHDVNRPLPDMMLGLESWIPLYMTGQISPYYLPNPANAVFCHSLRTSGAAALSGEGVRGHREHDRYRFTTKRTEVTYLQTRAQDLISLSKPLMNIYRKGAMAQFHRFLKSQAGNGRIRRILSAPPIYTIEPECLDAVLQANGITGEQAQSIRHYVEQARVVAQTVQSHNLMLDEFPIVDESEFEDHPVNLPLSGMFMNMDVRYPHELYRQHVRSTLKAAERNANYEVACDLSSAFRNIQITVSCGQWAMVSKDKSPAIHFVIWHPKLVAALEHLEPPVFEQE